MPYMYELLQFSLIYTDKASRKYEAAKSADDWDNRR